MKTLALVALLASLTAACTAETGTEETDSGTQADAPCTETMYVIAQTNAQGQETYYNQIFYIFTPTEAAATESKTTDEANALITERGLTGVSVVPYVVACKASVSAK